MRTYSASLLLPVPIPASVPVPSVSPSPLLMPGLLDLLMPDLLNLWDWLQPLSFCHPHLHGLSTPSILRLNPPPPLWLQPPGYGPKVSVTPFPSQADGSVSCKRTDCVETCPYPIHIPGQCCPDCSAGDGDSRGRGDGTGLRALQPHSRPIGCTYMGRIFYNNETFPSLLDPCLSCICLVRHVGCGVRAFGHPRPTNARPSPLPSWARWPARPWTVPSSAPTPSTPRASAALSAKVKAGGVGIRGRGDAGTQGTWGHAETGTEGREGTGT